MGMGVKKPKIENSVYFIFPYFRSNQTRKKQNKFQNLERDAERITITIIIGLCCFC